MKKTKLLIGLCILLILMGCEKETSCCLINESGNLFEIANYACNVSVYTPIFPSCPKNTSCLITTEITDNINITIIDGCCDREDNLSLSSENAIYINGSLYN